MITTYEIYNSEKSYTTKDGQIYTPEEFKRDYPAVNIEKMVVEVMGTVIISVFSFSYLKGINGVKADIPDEQALNLISQAEDIKKTESSPMERIAAALEFLEILNM